MLKIFEWFLIDFRIEHIVNGIHLRLPVLLVHVTLLLHLTHGITVFLDVNLMGCALHRQPIDLFPEFEDISLVLTQASLHSAHPEVESTEASRSFCASELGLLFHSTNLFKRFLLLLADI